MYKAVVLRDVWPDPEKEVWAEGGLFETWEEARAAADSLADEMEPFMLHGYCCYEAAVLDEEQRSI